MVCVDRRVDKSRRRGGGQSWPPPWDLRRRCISSGSCPGGPAGPEFIVYSGGALPVAVAVRRRVVQDVAAGVPSKAETDTVESVLAAVSGCSVERLDRGDGWAMGVAAARASAEPVPRSMGMAKPEAKKVSVACDIDPRLVQTSVAAKEDETRATLECLRGNRKAVNPYTWLVCNKS